MALDLLFEQNEWTFFAARAAILAIAMLAFAFAFSSWRRAGRRDMQGVMEETRALQALTERLVAQVSAMEARLEDRRELVAAAAGPASRGYDLALQMARSGVAADEIANVSGVTRHEAQLLSRLHAPNRN
jgi:hypothetical protein